MTGTKEAAKNGKSHKRPNPNSHQGNPRDAPPSKKAKKNPPASTKPSNTTSNISQAEVISANMSAADQSNVPLPTSESPGDLTTTHDLTTITIISSTPIQKKVLRVLEILSVYPTPPSDKPRVVMMKAKAGVASKMISVAEIAKREVGKDGGKWFQYNWVEGVMVEAKEKGKKLVGKDEKGRGEDDKEGEGKEEEESEEETTAFETMKTPFERANERKPKMRAVPVMNLYLSRVRIDSLRKAYGEQTNALQAS